MSRDELLRLFVIDTMADDYESAAKVVSDAAVLARKCGMTLEWAEGLAILMSLVDSGLVRAYSLGPQNALVPEDFVPSRAEAEQYYYWLTDKGHVMQAAEVPGWPFDRRGDLRPGWALD